jgi:hypothetical protein
VAVGKGQSPENLMAAVEGGAQIIGENYLQEAERAYEFVGRLAQWHFIGHLQKNKVKRAVELFNMIETVDTLELAREIEKRCAQAEKLLPVLIEVNSAREENKSGVFPENIVTLAREISGLTHLRLSGLMTMGPAVSQPEESRQYFALTRGIFDELARLDLPNTEMKYLSMGMTDSYRVAIEEGANLVRIGKGIFGGRR